MLSAQHLAQLQASAISDAIAQERGYTSLDDVDELSQLKALGFSRTQQKLIPGLLIPLWSVQGGRHQTLHYRPDTPRLSTNGHTHKYEYPPARPMVLDCHPAGKPHIGDVHVPLWITEGEKKADSLLSHGARCVICLLGVDAWRTGDVPHHDWEYVALRGREVRIVYDSDLLTKRQVMRALTRLCAFLAHRGAVVFVVHLPCLDGAKVGVDDFLAGHSLSELDSLCRPWVEEARRTQAPPSTFAPTDTPLGDVYNAEAMARLHGHELRYCEPLGGWHSWKGTHWQQCLLGEPYALARQTLRELGREAVAAENGALLTHIGKCFTHSRLTNMLLQAATMLPLVSASGAFDTDPWLLNCTNGTLNLKTGELQAHRQDDYITRCLAVAYDPDAPAPRWKKFLQEITGWSEHSLSKQSVELMGFLQVAVGYSLVGTPTEDCLFLLHGEGRNGKSVFLDTISRMLGPYARVARMETFLHSEVDTVRNDLADLRGVRFVCASETDENKRFAEGLIKQITGGEKIKARFLYKEYFEFLPQFSLFLSFNHEPKIYGTDTAIWERIHKIPLTVYIEPEDRDKGLREILALEVSGILSWAVRGCMEWQKYGLSVPQCVSEATKTYRKDSDVIAQYCAEMLGESGDENSPRVFCVEVWERYREWTKRTGEFMAGRNKFRKRLRELYRTQGVDFDEYLTQHTWKGHINSDH